MKKSSYESVKDWRKKNKSKLVQAFGSKCGVCGLVDDPIVYDFHHLDPAEKDFNVTVKIMSWPKVVQEASKCCMLCSHCHRKVHAKMVELPVDVARFDETRIETKILSDECPVCSTSKPVAQTTCSTACSRRRRQKIDWDAIDLMSIYKRCGSLNAMKRELGVSDVAIRKQMKKRGFLDQP